MKSDSEIQRDVMRELEWEPGLNAENIGVAVKDSVVTLSGSVDSFAEKWAAEHAVKRISGVLAVVENIEVDIPLSNHRTDADIARAALHILEWSTALPSRQVKVTVQNGWVTVEGQVESLHQKYAAYDAIRNLLGVRGVSNQIMVRPKSIPADVKGKIREAFERNARLDAKRIDVATADGKVILTGTVRSWTEREEAERAACAAPGVCEVENNLDVRI